MTRQQIVLRPLSLNRRQPLLNGQSSTGSLRLAEVAGGTTAECAAVCCCCPCGLINLFILIVYKIPASLCRRALRSRRRWRRQRLIKKGQLQLQLQLPSPLQQPTRHRCACGCDESELNVHPITTMAAAAAALAAVAGEKAGKFEESENEVEALEKEMWDRFYGTGFWRSNSQRDHCIDVKL